MKMLRKITRFATGSGPGGLLPAYKSDGGGRRKISRTGPHIKGTRILFYGHVPNSFPPLKGANSTTINYITGTANLITVVKITFELFLLKDFGNHCRKSLS